MSRLASRETVMSIRVGHLEGWHEEGGSMLVQAERHVVHVDRCFWMFLVTEDQGFQFVPRSAK